MTKSQKKVRQIFLKKLGRPNCTYACKLISFKAILSKNSKILQINQKLCFMLLESAWRAVYLIQILYLFLQNYSQERPLKILNRNFRPVWTGNPDFFAALHVTLMNLKFKTLTFKIDGLWATKRVLNHKSIPIYNLYWWWWNTRQA